MNSTALLLFITLAVSSTVINACKFITAGSDEFGLIEFHQIPLDEYPNSNTGRAAYVSANSENPQYLYHIQLEDTSRIIGRWVINDILDSKDTAVAYVNSWSVSPHLTKFAAGNFESHWSISVENDWRQDPTLVLVCTDPESPAKEKDSSIFFESSLLQPSLTGFYIERVLSPKSEIQTRVYSHIKTDPRKAAEAPMFLFQLNNQTWMIGDQYGVDAGVAFLEDSADYPFLFSNPEWRFIAEGDSWVFDDSAEIYHPDRSATQEVPDLTNIYNTLRFMRSIKFLPARQKYVTMRNEVPIPQIGLGTGGIPNEEAPAVISEALVLGYRFLDLAREYGNEHLIPSIFKDVSEREISDPELVPLPSRKEVFLQSKVWPTQLGVLPTLDAIYDSLFDMKTSYIDSFLLHWPACNAEVEWMHCEDTVDPEGTWEDSWTVLEKAYSEGLVNSIGVSNFNIELLRELEAFAVVLPHIVQNYAAPGSLDFEVRDYCVDRDIVYQPYASGRNIDQIQGELKNTIQDMALEKNISEYTLVHKFFLETGAVTIPRTTNIDHLKANLHMQDWELTEKEMHKLGWGVDEDQFQVDL